MDYSVAELKDVPLCETWPNEESDFTPWLADNISSVTVMLSTVN